MFIGGGNIKRPVKAASRTHHRIRQIGRLSLRHPAAAYRHRKGAHLVIGDFARSKALDEFADLGGAQRAAFALFVDDKFRDHKSYLLPLKYAVVYKPRLPVENGQKNAYAFSCLLNIGERLSIDEFDIVDLETFFLKSLGNPGLFDFDAPAGLDAPEKAGQRERTLALIVSKIRIPRRHRKPRLLAHDGSDNDIEIEIKIAHHPLYHLGLLVILLAENREIGVGEIEKFGDDSADSAEVAGAARPAKPLRKKFLVNIDAMILKIHILRRRKKYRRSARRAALREIGLLVSRIFFKILVRPELDRIYKNADDNLIGLAFFSLGYQT